MDKQPKFHFWHKWSKWSDPFYGTWTSYNSLLNTRDSYGAMSQKRICTVCGKVQYKRCN